MFGSRQNPIIASDAILSDEEINLIIQNNVSQLHIQQIGQIDSLTARLNIASNTNNNLSADMQDLRMENVALQNRILHYKLNEQTAIDKIANLQREINYLRDLIGNKNLPVIIPNPRTQPRATSTAYASSSQQPLSGNINSHWHNQHNLPRNKQLQEQGLTRLIEWARRAKGKTRLQRPVRILCLRPQQISIIILF